MSKYEVKYLVDNDTALSSLISAVSKTSGIDLVSVETVPDLIAKPRRRQYVNGIKNKGISGPDLVLEILTSGTKNINQIQKVFVERGFAAASYAATLTRLTRAKKIEHVGHGLYQLAKK